MPVHLIAVGQYVCYNKVYVVFMPMKSHGHGGLYEKEGSEDR